MRLISDVHVKTSEVILLGYLICPVCFTNTEQVTKVEHLLMNFYVRFVDVYLLLLALSL